MKKQQSPYKSFLDWRKKFPQAYKAALKYGLIDSLCVTFGWKIIKKWTKEKCIEDAFKYSSRVEWIKKSASAYNAARINGWLKECCGHMLFKQRPNGYWSKKKCIEDALKYTRRSEWERSSGSAYGSARLNGWLDECCAHMVEGKKQAGYWTKKRCIEDALNYKKQSDWRKNCGNTSYSAAKKKGWLKECCAHMVEGKKQAGYWTKELCKEDALNYKKQSEWRLKSNKSHNAAYKNGWLNECCTHMIDTKKPNGYWTKERCIENALNYKTKGDWIKNSGGAYNSAHKNGWLKECCIHMK